jgi:hypothetical protein
MFVFLWIAWKCGYRTRIRWKPTFVQNEIAHNWGPGLQRDDGTWSLSTAAGGFGADYRTIQSLSPVSPSGYHTVYVKKENVERILAALLRAAAKNLVHDIRTN